VTTLAIRGVPSIRSFFHPVWGTLRVPLWSLDAS
jgi:hypothetical protein